MEVADENFTPQQHEQRNRLKSASGSDVYDPPTPDATTAAPTSSASRQRGVRAPSEPLEQPRKNSGVGRIPEYLGEPINAQMLDIKEEQEDDNDIRKRFQDPKAKLVRGQRDDDDLISFDDDAFDDDDDDAFVVDKESSSSPKEPSIDSCVDALEQNGAGSAAQCVNSRDRDASQSSRANSSATGEQNSAVAQRQASGEFEVVTQSEVSSAIKSEKTAALHALLSGAATHARRRRKLRDGFRWQKQLVFRYKLTMHTAFERKDNSNPASVTSIAMSR